MLFMVNTQRAIMEMKFLLQFVIIPENKNRLPLCNSRKDPYPSQGWSLEIPKGRGVSKAKIFKGTYESKLEIPGGWGGGGSKPKNHPWGMYGYFLEPHILKLCKLVTNILVNLLFFHPGGFWWTFVMLLKSHLAPADFLSQLLQGLSIE